MLSLSYYDSMECGNNKRCPTMIAWNVGNNKLRHDSKHVLVIGKKTKNICMDKKNLYNLQAQELT